VLGLADEHDVSLLFWEGSRRGLTAPAARAIRKVLVITGPEGGFSAGEARDADRRGLTLVGLGPRILRAETAAIAAVTLCQHLWGDLTRS
jgi:16S rRNA (uracil1498-N3)-methyltransferase